MRQEKFIIESERRIPVVAETDVVVVGGGPGGVAAAVAASRNGAEVLLVERYGCLGGLATIGLVWYLPVKNFMPEPKVTGGIPKELVDKLLNMGKAVNPKDFDLSENKFAHFGFDGEVTKHLLLTMAVESGVKFLFQSQGVDVIKEGDTVKGVIVENKSGRQAILANVVVDATGDADLVARAGAPYEKGNPENGEVYFGATVLFLMANIDWEKYLEYERKDRGIKNLLDNAFEKGLLPPLETPIVIAEYPIGIHPIDIHLKFRQDAEIWASHVQHVDATDAIDLTRAEVVARTNIMTIANFLINYVPGFKSAYIGTSSPLIGIRESRRILGEYMLTKQDILEGGKFDDSIGRGCTYDNLPFDIPFRCIIPKNVDNLLVAGRPFSISYEAYKTNTTFHVDTCMITGEGAGTAAALATKEKVNPKDLNIKILQNTLLAQGVFI